MEEGSVKKVAFEKARKTGVQIVVVKRMNCCPQNKLS